MKRIQREIRTTRVERETSERVERKVKSEFWDEVKAKEVRCTLNIPVSITEHMFNSRTSYKRQEPSYILRRYFLGPICVANLYRYPDEDHPAGRAAVHMTTVPTPGGKWFKSVKKANKFIMNELKRIPNEQ